MEDTYIRRIRDMETKIHQLETTCQLNLIIWVFTVITLFISALTTFIQ